MPMEVDSPPQMHEPNHHNARPKGILKNPSFSGSSGSPANEDPPSVPFDPQESKEITIQNTLQNAGHRRSSSAARRSSNSRRQSSAAGLNNSADEDPDRMRLKWDEANLYLAEQEAGGRMKITEPKTPFEYGKNAMDEEEDEEDVSIDPRYVNVDEMEMTRKNSTGKKARESDIPGLELGEPEDETAGADLENDRIVRGSMSRETSKDKHVNVHDQNEQPGMASEEDEEKHKLFEEQRKKHYEMRNVKDMLGHPETSDDEDEDMDGTTKTSLPRRGVNGGP